MALKKFPVKVLKLSISYNNIVKIFTTFLVFSPLKNGRDRSHVYYENENIFEGIEKNVSSKKYIWDYTIK